MKNIRQFLLITSLMVAPVAHAAHIDATSIYQLHGIPEKTGHSGNWVNGTGDVNPASLFAHVSDTASDSATGRDTVVFNTFVMSRDANAMLALGFGSEHVANRPGPDLAIFTIDPLDPEPLDPSDPNTRFQRVLAPTVLDVSIGEATGRYRSQPIIIDSLLQGVFGPDSNDPDTHPDLLGANGVVLIDLDDFVASGALINAFSIDVLGAAENPTHYPAITAVGSFNTAVVPLPLPAVLFGSGLALLGFVGRRKKR